MPQFPEKNLAVPVVIEWEDGDGGTGFFLRQGDTVFLVTATHVLLHDDDQLLGTKFRIYCQAGEFSEKSQHILEVDAAAMHSQGEMLFSATGDVAIMRAIELVTLPDKTKEAFPRENIQIIHIGLGTIVHVALGIGTAVLDEVIMGEDVFVGGYPRSLGLKDDEMFDKYRPLFRKGIVAQVSPASQSFVIECPTYPGNSGGPVFQQTKLGGKTTHKVIGVVTEFIPREEVIHAATGDETGDPFLVNSGFSLVWPMDEVEKLLAAYWQKVEKRKGTQDRAE